MRKFVFLLFFLTTSTGFTAEGNPSAGQEKSAACAACHGAYGVSSNPEWPSIAGQHAGYLFTQLKLFKEGQKRNNPLMAGPVAELTEQDMRDLAAYYSQQKLPEGETPKKFIKPGEKLYRGGDLDKHISACIGCHGPRGLGNAQAHFPVLSGQQPVYIVNTLEDYRSGKRTSDMFSIMRDISSRMSKEDMEAVANYVSGLH